MVASEREARGEEARASGSATDTGKRRTSTDRLEAPNSRKQPSESPLAQVSAPLSRPGLLQRSSRLSPTAIGRLLLV